MKTRVLFLSTYNSGRSQMAEGLTNHYLGDRVSAYSAGAEATSVNQSALAVMAEIGIDIARQSSKDVGEFYGEEFDFVITLVSEPQEKCFIHGAVSYCGRCGEVCPHLEQMSHGGQRLFFYGYSDLAKITGDEEQALAEFRKTRDDIKTWSLQFFQYA